MVKIGSYTMEELLEFPPQIYY